MEKNKEQQPTIDEVLRKHTCSYAGGIIKTIDVKAAMKEYASIETEQLRQENQKLKMDAEGFRQAYISASEEATYLTKLVAEYEQEEGK